MTTTMARVERYLTLAIALVSVGGGLLKIARSIEQNSLTLRLQTVHICRIEEKLAISLFAACIYGFTELQQGAALVREKVSSKSRGIGKVPNWSNPAKLARETVTTTLPSPGF